MFISFIGSLEQTGTKNNMNNQYIVFVEQTLYGTAYVSSVHLYGLTVYINTIICLWCVCVCECDF